MKHHCLLVFCLLAVGAQISSVLSTTQPRAVIDEGVITGKYETTVNDRKISSFIGIPYAEPPIGSLRFQEAIEGTKWSGVLNATISPPECLQYSHVTYHFPYCPVVGSEDCLYLNVYTPKLFDGSNTKLMDVIVYIHPGSWMYFSSTYQSPSILLDKDVVFVTFNYRLGPLGFLSTGDHVIPGNNGLKDQILALKWVQKNIAVFGGNPKSVTIAGLSSGGASVHLHLLSPLSKGLFKRAISSSGSSLCPWSLAENVKEKASKVANELGCPTGDSQVMVDCLRNRPAEHIVGMSKMFMPWLYNPYSPYGPVIEPESTKAFISEHPLNIIKQGKAQDIPWLTSFTSDEGLYPAAEILGTPSYIADLKSRWDELLPFILDYNYTVAPNRIVEVSQAIKDHYKIDLNAETGRKNFVQMVGDRLYLQGIVKAAKMHASRYKSPVYAYQFSYSGKHSVSDVLTKFKGAERLGVCHGDDALYIMPLPWFNLKDKPGDLEIATILRDIWIEFAANGKLDWTTVNEHLPQLSVVDIKSFNDLEQINIRELGEDDFWSSLGLNENKEFVSRDEL